MTRDKYDDEAERVVADVVRAVVLSTSDRGASISIEASPMSAALVAIILRRVAADATRAGAEAERASFAAILRENIDGWSDNGAELAAHYDITEGRTRQLAALIVSDALECAFMDDRERVLAERFADLERRLAALATTTEAHEGER